MELALRLRCMTDCPLRKQKCQPVAESTSDMQKKLNSVKVPMEVLTKTLQDSVPTQKRC